MAETSVLQGSDCPHCGNTENNTYNKKMSEFDKELQYYKLWVRCGNESCKLQYIVPYGVDAYNELP